MMIQKPRFTPHSTTCSILSSQVALTVCIGGRAGIEMIRVSSRDSQDVEPRISDILKILQRKNLRTLFQLPSFGIASRVFPAATHKHLVVLDI